MWLEKLKELKRQSGISSKDIAAKANIPETTVKRIFSGDTDNPYADTLYHIVNALGGSLDDIFADSKAVVGTRSLSALQDACAALEKELDEKNKHIDTMLVELEKCKHSAEIHEKENQFLKRMLDDKDELITMQRGIITHYRNKYPS